MTDNEIIKALEGKLPLGIHAIHEAIDLINRQKAEIERLRNDLAKEFVCFVGSPHKVENCPFFEELENERAEAVKEFAERLTDKADLIKVNAFDSKFVISQEDIDNLVKEMVGENNE